MVHDTARHGMPVSPDPLLVRGMRVTWWYTFGGILSFEAIFLIFAASLLTRVATLDALLVLGVGGAAWMVVTALLLIQYRRCATTGDEPARTRVWIALAVALVLGIAFLGLWGLWVFALIPLVQCVLLLQCPPGVRSRLTLLGTALLVVAAVFDGRELPTAPASPDTVGAWWFTLFYVCIIPLMSVFSLWWWDVVVRLDQARAAESRLAATQERLRVATDVHDLQGHHLQVIALQLELAERLMQRDPEAALAQLAEARRSVDAARQGTRDIAKPFLGVPLPDEIANAADLLRAAGATVEVTIDPGAERAPADVLGPVIRETTTNVLKHGGGKWATLSLTRDSSGWRYVIANDPGAATPPTNRSGSGLDGMLRRMRDAGGSLHIDPAGQRFTVTAVTA